MIAVDSFRPYFRREWIKGLHPKTARSQLLKRIAEWAEEISKIPLTRNFIMDHWDTGIQVATGGHEYSKLIWFIIRSHYNLYCLSTNRKTIEELALGAYAYYTQEISQFEKSKNAALADFRRLLRLSNSFLLAEWVHDMIEKAISNRDETFFKIISNSVKKDFTTDPSSKPLQWMLVVLLYFAGGKDYKRRREFLHKLQINGILSKSMDITSFNAEFAKIGLSRV